MAVAATNCRRESFFRDIWHSSVMSQSEILLLLFSSRRAGRTGITRRCRISLSRSEQNCRRLSRNQVLGGSRTNVVLKPEAGRFLLSTPIANYRPARDPPQFDGEILRCTHGNHGCAPAVRNSAAGSSSANLTRSFVEHFFIGPGGAAGRLARCENDKVRPGRMPAPLQNTHPHIEIDHGD